MDLTTWMADELTDMRTRLASGVLDLVPIERHKERVDGGGSTITSLLWHLARHHDVAINAVVRGAPQVLEDHRAACGAAGLTAADGLAETEAQEITDRLDPLAVVAYHDAVCAATATWLTSLRAVDLDAVPDAGAALDAAGVEETAVPWLHRMWEGKPVSFHVRWEAIGHGVSHTGEMVSMRNRMGLSPF